MVPTNDEDFSITKASDWPMLIVVGGLLVAVIGGMWIDLKSTIRESRIEWRDALEKHEAKNDRENEKIWKEIERCQDSYRVVGEASK